MSPTPPREQRNFAIEPLAQGDTTSRAQHLSAAASPSPEAGAAEDAREEEEADEEQLGATKPDEEAGSSQEAAWQAVWSAEANAWYFWNAETNETTWQNPRDQFAAVASSSTTSPATAAPPAADTSSVEEPDRLPQIDPELAWLDPAAARASSSGGLAQAARFNARTGRFMADPALNPDRLSEYQRGRRQQEAYYDVAGWEASLASRPPKREHEDAEQEDGKKKRPSAKQVEKFRQAKEDKKRKKLASWLGS
ncbi:WW/Rsp5/WWP domain containing protein [Rhodotorula toruloides]|uniref:WW/Rsp5/WWP domain containing protein n=1 Tax=Rhodotorula toruloides TaxID=5286 RepID=A0A511KIG1_RHOTO|nr:WW/Rsp5/WWP domain containing protein [Rhodotorula toruloides]